MRKISLLVIGISIIIGVSAQSTNPKRGLAFSNPPVQVEDIQAMSDKISWYYNWANSPESNVEDILLENNVEFIPMAWNDRFNAEKLRTYYTNHPESKYLLGFNEPNFLHQANMTPSEAAAAWPLLEAIAAEFDLEIVGPAVNWCGECVSEGGTTYNDPYDYLDDFFEACPDCQVDYIAVHNYMCYASPLIAYLEKFKKYEKKIWLTEYACWDQPTITLDMQKNLMIGSLDYLDNDTMICKYAWFMARTGAGTPHLDIFTSEAGVPTELGEIYLNFNSIHDSLYYSQVPGRVEAESYSAGYEVQMEVTSDFDGIANVGWIDGGDWLQYNIDVPEAGDYYLYMRVAATTNTSVDVWIDDAETSIPVDITSTGGWQNWTTIGIPVTLSAGDGKIKLTTYNGGFNVNWIAITENENTAPTVSAGDDQEIELPVSSVELAGIVEDSDNDDLEYKWEKKFGGTCEILYPDSASTTVSGLSEGPYRFGFYVSDGLEVVYDEVTIKVIDPVAVEEMVNNGYSVYPNPVGDLLTIELPAEGGSSSVEVMSITGQVLWTKDYENSPLKLEIDFSGFNSGTYLIRIRNEDTLQTFRILK